MRICIFYHIVRYICIQEVAINCYYGRNRPILEFSGRSIKIKDIFYQPSFHVIGIDLELTPFFFIFFLLLLSLLFFLLFFLFFFSVSGEVPQEPVISTKTGHLFERRLIEKYLTAGGKCPISGVDLNETDLLSVQGMFMYVHVFYIILDKKVVVISLSLLCIV